MAVQLPQLRVAVNARCGRSCFYCRPSGEGLATHSRKELSVDELIPIASECQRLGIHSIKLTGGDPALWPPLVTAVRRLKSEAGFSEVHVISRHPKIGELAEDLANAGTDLINISVDSIDRNTHREITGTDDLTQILAAVERTLASGTVVKINTVIMAGVNDGGVFDLVNYFESLGVQEVKLLDVIQDLDSGIETFSRRLAKHRGGRLRDLYVPIGPIVDRLRTKAVSTRSVRQGGLGHPMIALRFASGMTVTVKDHTAGAWYGSICETCPHFPCHDALMALRLTADLRLQFCLLRDDAAIDLRDVVARRPVALRQTIESAFQVYRDAQFVGSADVTQPLRPVMRLVPV